MFKDLHVNQSASEVHEVPRARASPRRLPISSPAFNKHLSTYERVHNLLNYSKRGQLQHLPNPAALLQISRFPRTSRPNSFSNGQLRKRKLLNKCRHAFWLFLAWIFLVLAYFTLKFLSNAFRHSLPLKSLNKENEASWMVPFLKRNPKSTASRLENSGLPLWFRRFLHKSERLCFWLVLSQKITLSFSFLSFLTEQSFFILACLFLENIGRFVVKI